MYNYGSEAKSLEETQLFNGSKVKVNKEARKRAIMEEKIEAMKKSALKSLVVIAVLLAVIMVREAKIDQLCGQISDREGTLKNISAVVTEKEMQL